MNHLAADTLNLAPEMGWREKIIYPILLFGILQSLVYLSVVNTLRLNSLYFYFTVIIIAALAITHLRLVFGLYVPNILVGPLTIAYFMRDLYGTSSWTDFTWLTYLYRDLVKCLVGFRHLQFFRVLELSYATYVFLAMVLTWFLVYLLLRRLVNGGKIMGLLLIALAFQGFVFSYIDRRFTGVNLLLMLLSLMLISTVRLGRLQLNWKRQTVVGVEDISFGWASRSIGLIILIVAIGAILPSFQPSILKNNLFLAAVAGRFPQKTAAPVNRGSSEQPTTAEQTPPQVDPVRNAFVWNAKILGGAWNPDETLVMTVNSDYSAYWRGGAMDIYTGSGWVEGIWDNPTGENDSTYASINTIKVEQTITMANSFASSPVVFGATMPETVNGLKSGVARNFNDNLVLQHALTGGTTYQVSSILPVLDAKTVAVLRSSGNSYPSTIKQRYLELPSLPARVKTLAQQITQKQDNPYDKAKALEDYFQNNDTYKYTLKPSETPKTQDFVDYFLFNSKQGYCTYFSTAMAVMAREVGLPSRWVIGYATGSVNEKFPNTYRVTAADEHAWVEIYFNGVGWIPFEPTKSFSMPTTVAPNQQPASIPPKERPQTPKVTWLSVPQLSLIIVGVVICLGLVLLLYLKQRKSPLRPGNKYWQLSTRRQSPRLAILGIYRTFLKLMDKSGHKRLPGQTPREFAGQHGKTLGLGQRALESLTLTFERVRYGKFNPTGESVIQAKQALTDIGRKLENKSEQK